MCVCVCVFYVRLLSMDSTELEHMKEEGERGRSPPPSSAVSQIQRRGESSLQSGFILWLNIDAFTLNISRGFKVCPAPLQ